MLLWEGMEKNIGGSSLLEENGVQEASSDKQWLVLPLARAGLREMWELQGGASASSQGWSQLSPARVRWKRQVRHQIELACFHAANFSYLKQQHPLGSILLTLLLTLQGPLNIVWRLVVHGRVRTWISRT